MTNTKTVALNLVDLDYAINALADKIVALHERHDAALAENDRSAASVLAENEKRYLASYEALSLARSAAETATN